MTKKKLKNYAYTIVKKGLNVQVGQIVWIYASLDQIEFIRMLVEYCYAEGAKYVKVYWSDSDIEVLTFNNANSDYLATVQEWEINKKIAEVSEKPCILHIISDDPDKYKKVEDTSVISKIRAARYAAFEKYIKELDNKQQWCIAAVPSEKWAKKIFPKLTTDKAIDKLWDAILKCSLINDETSGVANWDIHNYELAEHAMWLNSLHIEKLVYKSSNGTDFTVGLIPDAQFCAGSETTLDGIEFNPNIPTQECFTSPMKGQAEGIVYSTKPLSYKGHIIDKFNIRFKNGKAVDVHAKKGEKYLKELIAEDENACYLGEVALVPFNSPINETGLLFYNTLFDENACCHLALGRGFTNVIKNFEKYTTEELHEKGVNDSSIHVDFMIGSRDLKILAYVSGNSNPITIFENGVWKASIYESFVQTQAKDLFNVN